MAPPAIPNPNVAWADILRRANGWPAVGDRPVAWPDLWRRANGWPSANVDTTDTADCPECDPCVIFANGFSDQTEFDRWYDTISGTAVVSNNAVSLSPGTTCICRARTPEYQKIRITTANFFQQDSVFVFLDWVDSSNYHGIEMRVDEFARRRHRYFKIEGGNEVLTVEKNSETDRTSMDICFHENFISIDGIDSSPVTVEHDGKFVGFGSKSSNVANVGVSEFQVLFGPDADRHYQCPSCRVPCPECLDGLAPFAMLAEIEGHAPEFNGTHRLEMSEMPFDEGCRYENNTFFLRLRPKNDPPIGWNGPITWSFELGVVSSGAIIGIDDNAFPSGVVPCTTVTSLILPNQLINNATIVPAGGPIRISASN